MLPIAPSTETRPCLETVCKNDAPRMIHLDATGGEAAEILYSVFPGMELIYRDIHARSCREARGDSGERLEIHHCLEGLRRRGAGTAPVCQIPQMHRYLLRALAGRFRHRTACRRGLIYQMPRLSSRRISLKKGECST